MMERVCKETELADLTAMGWEVVERYEVQEPEGVTRSHANNSPGGYPFIMNDTELARHARFRLRLNEESAIAALSARINGLASEAQEARNAKSLADDARAKAEKERDRATTELNYEKEQSKRARIERDQAQNRIRKMETDLAAVREHFGKKAFDDALATAGAKS